MTVNRTGVNQLTQAVANFHPGDGDLDLRRSTITSLPVGLVVHGDLDLSNTPVTSLGGTNVETECTDAKLNAFLETWSPWMKHQRSLLVPAYEKLEVTDRKLENDETCMFGGLLTQPVLYNNTVYEYATFVKWYIDDGTDPTNREKIDPKKLKRIVIPLKA